MQVGQARLLLFSDREKFLRLFEERAFAPANAQKDLLILMLEAYAETIGRSLDTVKRWVEKTPANRNHLPADLQSLSAGKSSSHDARSASDLGRADCARKNAKAAALLNLLLRQPLVEGGHARSKLAAR